MVAMRSLEVRAERRVGSSPTTRTKFCWGLAQLVEQRVLIPFVAGSTPAPLARTPLQTLR